MVSPHLDLTDFNFLEPQNDSLACPSNSCLRSHLLWGSFSDQPNPPILASPNTSRVCRLHSDGHLSNTGWFPEQKGSTSYHPNDNSVPMLPLGTKLQVWWHPESQQMKTSYSLSYRFWEEQSWHHFWVRIIYASWLNPHSNLKGRFYYLYFRMWGHWISDRKNNFTSLHKQAGNNDAVDCEKQ